MKQMTRDDIYVGRVLYYTSFGTTDYAIIKVVGKNSRPNKRGIFTFDAVIVDNSHWSVADRYDWSKVGAVKKFNNCFVAPSFDDLKSLVNRQRNDTIRALPYLLGIKSLSTN